MLAADMAEAAVDLVPDEMVATESIIPIAVDEWQAWDPAVCELQRYDFVDPMTVVEPVIIGGFPLELAPPVPDYGVFSWGGEATVSEDTDAGLGDVSGSLDVVSDWSWDGSCEVAAAPVEERDVAVAMPTAVDPRSAAFADMSLMGAVAAAAQGHAAEAAVFGGGRRRR